MRLTTLAIAALLFPLTLPAADDTKAEDAKLEAVTLEAVTVVGAGEKARKAGGSRVVLTAEQLEQSRVFTTPEALRKAGLVVRDEEGLGLRPNIGIRGQNPTRSTKTLLLEDGIPLAYAPYGDNASYYHPPIERFSRIEVLKGAGQTLYGPQTLSGLVNYITPAPSETLTGGLSLAAGERHLRNVHGYISKDGMRLDVMTKHAEGSRANTESTLNDFSAKGVFNLSASQRLTLRASSYREDSRVSYTGITDAELANFGAEYNPFEHDTFDASRNGASATHEWNFAPGSSLRTSVYTAYFKRDWWRQASTTTDTQCGNAFRDARLRGDRVNPAACNSTQGRLRDYRTYGIEPRLTLASTLFSLPQETIAGVRLHGEKQERIQKNGTTSTARDGTVVESNRREARALAGYLHHTVRVGALSVTPGVRVEQVEYERLNRLPGGRGGETDFSDVLPSFSLSYSLGEATTVFGGVHRAYAPPSVADLIDNNGGTVVALNAERGVNAEIGLRSSAVNGLKGELVVFRNSFSNQIAVGSIAGGNTPLAEGRTEFTGVELNGRADFAKLAGSAMSVSPFLELAWTYLPTAEARSPFRQVSNGAAVAGSAAGKRLPYAPEHQLTSTFGVERGGVQARVEAVYIAEQFADFANTERAPVNGNGQIGRIEDSLSFNATLNADVPGAKGLTAFVAAKNLTDEDDIVDRTRGIVVMQSRLVFGGVGYKF